MLKRFVGLDFSLYLCTLKNASAGTEMALNAKFRKNVSPGVELRTEVKKSKLK